MVIWLLEVKPSGRGSKVTLRMCPWSVARKMTVWSPVVIAVTPVIRDWVNTEAGLERSATSPDKGLFLDAASAGTDRPQYSSDIGSYPIHDIGRKNVR